MRPILNEPLTRAFPPLRHRARRRGHLAALATAVVTALAGMGMVTVSAVAASAAPPAPAHGVTPGAAAVSSSENDMFFTATDGSVWNVNPRGVEPFDLRSVGGRLVSAPAAIWTGSQLIVFGQGTDNQLWYTTCPPFASGSCSAWGPLGGKLTSKPGAAFAGPTAAGYSVYVRSTDGALWARDHSTAGWNAWHFIGGQILSGTGPAATGTNGGSAPVVTVVGTDRELFVYGRTGTETHFVDFGGQTTSSPGITYLGGGNLAVFARGTNNAGWYRTSSLPIGPTGPWTSIGGRLTSGVAADTVTGGETSVFGLGTDNQVYENQGQFPAFGGWNRLTGY